jgi:uncharacterized DUF497 family protein
VKDFGFEWDDAKADANLRKHGVSFLEVMTVFDEATAPFGDVLHSAGEDRFIIVGVSERNRLLTVVFTYRDEETIRIISARRSNRREQQFYEQETRIH